MNTLEKSSFFRQRTADCLTNKSCESDRAIKTEDFMNPEKSLIINSLTKYSALRRIRLSKQYRHINYLSIESGKV